MIREEAIDIIRAERECVYRQGRTGECCRDDMGCGACDLVQEDTKIMEAYDMAIEALKDRPHGEWVPVTYRPMDEEEYEEYREEFGELPIEDRKMFACPMPEHDQDILICTSWGGVSQDRCELDEYGYALETQGDWDGVLAWMPLPEPYKEEGDSE